MVCVRLPTKYGFSLELNPESHIGDYLKNHQEYEVNDSNLVVSLLRQGDYCIDAGAHVGYYSLLMASRGATVLAIEPNPRNFMYLERNVEGSSVMTSAVALSDTDSAEMVDFKLPSDFDDGWGSLAAADPNADGRTTKVFTMRMDNLLATGALLDARWKGRIRLVKMDVEGSEVPALRGFGERLRDVDYVLIECSDISSRVAVSGSTVEGINTVLDGWYVQYKGKGVPKAWSNGDNFLFGNPRRP